MDNRLGLHARPAARFVGALGGLDVRVEVSNVTGERGPRTDAASPPATLAVGQGDEILVRPAAHRPATRSTPFVRWRRTTSGTPRRRARTEALAAPEPPPAAAPPKELGAGTRLDGVPASPGIASAPRAV